MALRRVLLFMQRISFFIVLAAFIYTVFRAFTISIFHDEAFSYVHYASKPFWEIITYQGPVISNNHLLNSLLIKISVLLFGLSEFSVRLPALLGHGLYLFGVTKTLKLFLSNQRLNLGLIVMCFNPFVLEIFSAARGYALGLGFFSMGIYFFLFSLKGLEDKRSQMKALWFFALATLAHLAFLYGYVAFIAGLFIVIILEQVVQNKKSLRKTLREFSLMIFSSMFFLYLFYVFPVMMMRKFAQFSEGGTTGFWQDTVLSLIKASMYGSTSSMMILSIIQGVVGVFIIIGIGIVIYQIIKKEPLMLIDRYLLAMALMLGVCAMVVILQWHLFETKFIMGRRAIYFIPLFSLFAFIILEKIDSVFLKGFNNIGNMILVLFSSMTLIHFITSADLSRYTVCPYDASTKQVVKYLMKQNPQEEPKSIGFHWMFRPSLKFYKLKYDLQWLKGFELRAKPQGHDYYYMIQENNDFFGHYNLYEVTQAAKQDGLEVVKMFEEGQTLLAVKK